MTTKKKDGRMGKTKTKKSKLPLRERYFLAMAMRDDAVDAVVDWLRKPDGSLPMPEARIRETYWEALRLRLEKRIDDPRLEVPAE